MVYAPFVCRKCSKKRAERKEIITEIVETEQKYGRDLQIILEEFHRPMLRAGLLTSEQLSAIFLNVEELLEHNLVLAEKLKDSVEIAQVRRRNMGYFEPRLASVLDRSKSSVRFASDGINIDEILATILIEKKRCSAAGMLTENRRQ